MNVFIAYYPHNRTGKKDGDYFKAHATKAAKFYRAQGHDVTMFALPKGNDATKRTAFLKELLKHPTCCFARLLFFCHGTDKWCDAGLTVASMPCWAYTLHSALARWEATSLTTLVRAKDRPKIALFCCLTAKTPHNGLAAVISKATQAHVVMGHMTSGDTVFNPHKAAYYAGSGEQTKLLPPEGAVKFRAWLKKDNNALEFFESL